MCHDSCMGCVYVEVSFGSLRCSWLARGVSVVFNVVSVVSRLSSERGLSIMGKLQVIAYALSMRTRVCPYFMVCLSRIGVQLFSPISHRGARCLSSLSVYLSGGHWFQNCFA